MNTKKIWYAIGLVVAIGLLFLLLRKIYFITGFGKQIEHTLAIIKPDGVKAKNSGKIIDRIEHEGFNIIAMKKMQLSKEQAEKFYDIHRARVFFKELVDFMISGPIIVMVLEKENAIKTWHDLMGATDPKQASDGTIRQLYGTSISNNVTHGSDNQEVAKNEISLFFPEINTK